MDHRAFDSLARALGAGPSRRALLGGLLAALGVVVQDAAAAPGGEGKREGKGKGGRGGKEHGRNRPRRCDPKPRSEVCAGRCGPRRDNCGRRVRCPDCRCQPACAACERCDERTGRCAVAADGTPCLAGGDNGECRAGACTPCGTVGETCCAGGACLGGAACTGGDCLLPYGSPCTDDDQCFAGRCFGSVPGGFCGCDQDEDCPGSEDCIGNGTCVDFCDVVPDCGGCGSCQETAGGSFACGGAATGESCGEETASCPAGQFCDIDGRCVAACSQAQPAPAGRRSRR